jgi:hypothetical protein
MLGAIAGDIIGSVYEFHPIKTQRFPLFSPGSEWTDDTVLTMAVAQVILTGQPYAETFRAFGLEHPDAGYGRRFRDWLVTPGVGPYNSFGNGSAMRVSPVGWAFDTLEETLAEAQRGALHNACPEASNPYTFIRRLNKTEGGGMTKKRGVGTAEGKLGTRTTIPPTTVMHLWVAAAGRCEFPGCNRSLSVDDLTLKEGNYTNVAHIIAATSGGPRGDAEQSGKLASELSNLMLLCPTHHILIDSHKHQEEFSVPVLKKYKKRHEASVRIALENIRNPRRTVLTFVGALDGTRAPISRCSVVEALAPDVSFGEFMEIDASAYARDGDVIKLKMVCADVRQRALDELEQKRRERDHYPLCVFAMGRISVLVALGRALCGTDCGALYQHHVDTSSWRWRKEPTRGLTSDEDIVLHKPERLGGTGAPAIALNISGHISEDEVRSALNRDISLYTIDAGVPSRSFMKYKSQLSRFNDVWMELMGEMRELEPKLQSLPIFVAVPTSVAVQMGMSHVQADPIWSIYENRQAQGGWSRAVDLR